MRTNKINFLFILFSIVGSLTLKSQGGYDIRFNIKGNKDTMMYLVKYIWDQQYIVDTCKKIKNGQVYFNGKDDLDKGIYTLVSQGKSVYFDLFVNEGQKFTISCTNDDIVNTLKATGSKENELFISYIRYISNKNVEFNKFREQAKTKSKEDSTKFITEKLKAMNIDVKAFETDYMTKAKGTYVYDVLNLKSEKEVAEPPTAMSDSAKRVYQYYYYKSHFFDGIDFTDDRIIRTPFFDDRVKRYFESVILQHPDTIIQEIDKVLSRSKPDGLVYNLLIGYFTYKYEQSKIMGFDKIFVHLCDKYIISGKAKEVYSEETTKTIKNRADILRNLLLESKAPELYMIDTVHGKQVMKMGFDTAKTSKVVTDLYYKNIEKLTPMFKTLYTLKTKFTILVFWSVDCGHCQTEIPKLSEELKEIKDKIDFKVMAVYTKDDFEAWRKFIYDKKLDFINLFDPIHLNNLKDKYDIYSTPVIYILDKDKKIKAKRLGAEQVINMLKYLDGLEKK